MKAITIAICTHFVPSYNAHTEASVSFIRPRNKFLTARGCERLIRSGCDETQNEPRPDWVVVRVEHNSIGN